MMTTIRTRLPLLSVLAATVVVVCPLDLVSWVDVPTCCPVVSVDDSFGSVESISVTDDESDGSGGASLVGSEVSLLGGKLTNKRKLVIENFVRLFYLVWLLKLPFKEGSVIVD